MHPKPQIGTQTNPLARGEAISTENGKITKLDVNAFGLQGTLPAVFGNLTTLKRTGPGRQPPFARYVAQRDR